jgi:hypothetical protein
MKFNLLLAFFMSLAVMSCDPVKEMKKEKPVQSTNVEAKSPAPMGSVSLTIKQAAHGNTSRRGILPRDENGKEIEPPPGFDYYNLQVIVSGDCGVEAQHFCIDGKCLTLTIQNKKGKVDCKKGETIIMNASADPAMGEIKKCTSKYAGPAQLVCKVNGKEQKIEIKKMEEILPN